MLGILLKPVYPRGATILAQWYQFNMSPAFALRHLVKTHPVRSAQNYHFENTIIIMSHYHHHRHSSQYHDVFIISHSHPRSDHSSAIISPTPSCWSWALSMRPSLWLAPTAPGCLSAKSAICTPRLRSAFGWIWARWRLWDMVRSFACNDWFVEINSSTSSLWDIELHISTSCLSLSLCFLFWILPWYLHSHPHHRRRQPAHSWRSRHSDNGGLVGGGSVGSHSLRGCAADRYHAVRNQNDWCTFDLFLSTSTPSTSSAPTASPMSDFFKCAHVLWILIHI